MQGSGTHPSRGWRATAGAAGRSGRWSVLRAGWAGRGEDQSLGVPPAGRGARSAHVLGADVQPTCTAHFADFTRVAEIVGHTSA